MDGGLSQPTAAAVSRALDLLTADVVDAPDLQRQIDVGRLRVDQETQVRAACVCPRHAIQSCTLTGARARTSARAGCWGTSPGKGGATR